MFGGFLTDGDDATNAVFLEGLGLLAEFADASFHATRRHFYTSLRKLSKYISVGVVFKCFFPIINEKMKDCCKDKRGKCVRNGKVFTLSVQYETLYARSAGVFNEVFMCAVCGLQEEKNEEERSTQNKDKQSG